MKNIINSIFALAFVLLLSTSMLAQEKPEHKHSDKAMEETSKHVCTDKCKTDGCAAVDAKMSSMKHICTEECKTEGCAAVKAKEAMNKNSSSTKHVCTEDCKTKGCAAVKAKNGVSYECPMKCEPASDKPGKCSKCEMELKKV